MSLLSNDLMTELLQAAAAAARYTGHSLCVCLCLSLCLSVSVSWWPGCMLGQVKVKVSRS